MYDELELDTLGDKIFVNPKNKKDTRYYKTALFLIMSDTDSTFNFLISMIYTQLFNLLCEKADDVYGGRLPVHVRCLIDEAANIGQIPNLEKLVATIRSREISACLVLQAQSQLRPYLFPSPVAVWQRFLLILEKPTGRYPLYIHILDSLKRVGIAVTFASFFGVILGVLLGWSKWFSATMGVLFELLRPIPPLAWIPLITIWFGIGEFPKILIVFIGTFFNVVVNTSTGVKMVDKLQLDVGRMFQANQLQILKEIVLPASLPAIFAGIRVALGAGWAVVLAAEMLGSQTGVGYLITLGNEIGDTALIFISMIVIGVIGALLSALATFIERRLCPWMNGQQS